MATYPEFIIDRLGQLHQFGKSIQQYHLIPDAPRLHREWLSRSRAALTVDGQIYNLDTKMIIVVPGMRFRDVFCMNNEYTVITQDDLLVRFRTPDKITIIRKMKLVNYIAESGIIYTTDGYYMMNDRYSLIRIDVPISSKIIASASSGNLGIRHQLVILTNDGLYSAKGGTGWDGWDKIDNKMLEGLRWIRIVSLIEGKIGLITEDGQFYSFYKNHVEKLNIPVELLIG